MGAGDMSRLEILTHLGYLHGPQHRNTEDAGLASV